ncbi:MAG: phosphoenolpyruvate--protein phosphotransferase [Rhodospirillales bacterium]|nr:phosphoenolpyruvate--protein phosphotransferase [Rhodospirillales bacterium]
MAKRKSKKTKEIRFEGLGVSPGIGIGEVHLRESGAVAVPEYSIPATKVDAELDRLKEALTRSRRQIGRLRSKAKALPGAAGDELEFLLEAYFQMLKDSRLVRGVEKRISKDRINAESAVQAEIAEIAESFTAMDDAYIAARLDDIREVANRLTRNLTKAPRMPMSIIPEGSVVVAETLTPADTAQLDPNHVTGIATMLGGAEGHTAIMARALGIPAVLGSPGLLGGTKAGDTIIVDGYAGRIIINPAAETVAKYENRRNKRQREQRSLARFKDLPAVTKDGTKIDLQANVELPVEMAMVNQAGAAGVGLLRTEFIFMNRDDIPDEEEQYQSLKVIIEAMGRRPVTVRTLDVGGDKAAEVLTSDYGDSASSALGLRGIRLSLVRDDILETQFRAILRAGVHGPVRILLPMVSTASEVRRARDVLERAARRLRRRKVKLPKELPPLGVMIEVPGAALSADALARSSDFFAIGSNDLTMYTLAIDRGDEQVAHLYDPLHPAVLRLIQFSAQAGLRAGIPVSICGEMAGDPRYLALLLGLGIRQLSMTASNIPRIKQRLRDLDLTAAERRAGVIMDQVDAGRIAMLLDDFNALA